LGSYEIHCIGHSLGGGVSSLVAHSLRTDPAHRARLTAALCRGVFATGFGTPPVLTRELAEGCAAYTRTLVHNVRACVFARARVCLCVFVCVRVRVRVRVCVCV
jgi:alpha-beta hydrolase superfamily lysophospholipase